MNDVVRHLQHRPVVSKLTVLETASRPLTTTNRSPDGRRECLLRDQLLDADPVSAR
jgi:hypothetical protein